MTGKHLAGERIIHSDSSVGSLGLWNADMLHRLNLMTTIE